jgi:hypothetical protein
LTTSSAACFSTPSATKEVNDEVLAIQIEQAVNAAVVNSNLLTEDGQSVLINDAFSEKIISEYSKSQKTGNDTIRIFKRENDDLDCTLKGKNKKLDVTIAVKGTNIPFRVHIPEVVINDAEKKYDVKIPEGGFDDPRSTIAVITYNEDEKEKIDILYERAYFSLPVFDYVKQQWNMQNDINMVPMKEVKNVESKLEENSKEKKDSNSIEI